ncbi:GrpB family protein [Thiotrichales bacterium 19X7-9]|nr:GrpB family protein [Thiotrichales bacterium 19X7-9]
MSMNNTENEKIRKIVLVAHNDQWQEAFQAEADRIKKILGSHCLDIHHIGSTAIQKISAKPIIDMMPVVDDLSKIDQLNNQFEKLGYQVMGEFGIPNRRYYWKSKEKRTHHIHLFEKDNPHISRHLAFRDFLNQNLDYAKAYELIKTNLANAFSQDIDNYVKGKSAFIEYIDYKTGNADQIQKEATDDIEIVSYDSAWPKLANLEINIIKAMIKPLKLNYIKIEHIGSTAIANLSSKPIVDIFIVIEDIQHGTLWVPVLEKLGYIFWQDNPDKEHLRFFKGMPPYGKKRTHHVHIVAKENPRWIHSVLFRDILKKNQELKLEYEQLKLELAEQFKKDREAYRDKKHDFIKMVLRASGFDEEIKR